jgi:AcrR family transcriptional regulator
VTRSAAGTARQQRAAGRTVGEESSDNPSAMPYRMLVRAKLVHAARMVAAERGLDMTMEEAAIAAGLSRRTAFRYFPNRFQLIAEAFAEGMDSYRRHVPLEAPDSDPDEWVAKLCAAVHELNSRVGKLYWDLTFASNVDEEIQKTIDLHHRHRMQFLKSCTESCWRAYDGRGPAPSWLLDAFAIHLSSFTTVYFTDQLNRSIADVGAATANALQRLLRMAVAEGSSS